MCRRTIALRQFVAVLVVLSATLLACLLTHCAERGLSEKDAKTIANCQAEGRACNSDAGAHCFIVYDTCMLDGGMR